MILAGKKHVGKQLQQPPQLRESRERLLWWYLDEAQLSDTFDTV
jgi:hypothetical protein